MWQLPKERTSVWELVFSSTGINYFGPMLLKEHTSIWFTSGNYKRYGVVVMCLSTRATHFKLAEDFSADAFIIAMKRFIARGWQATTIYSDSSSNFSGVDRPHF